MMKTCSSLFVICALFFNQSGYAGMDEARSAFAKGEYAVALQEIQPLAERGDSDAQNFLGTMYFEGKGLHQDDVKAEMWFRKAAEKQDVRAQYNLGYMYETGRIAPQSQPLAGIVPIFAGASQIAAHKSKDREQAMAWYRKSAEQGYVNAQFALALMLSDRNENSQAAEWYRRAAEQGDAVSQFNLGLLYVRGQGIPQDYAQAFLWYRKAAEQGHAIAQNNLGALYYNGQGVERDYAKALAWFRKAADQGNAEAKGNLDTLNFAGPTVLPKRRPQSQPQQKLVTAQVGDPSVPGAIICQDYDTVSLMIQLYRNSMLEKMRASYMGAERERRLHGAPSSAPNLKRFGCVLVPSGTSMKWEGEWLPAIVIVELSDGKIVKGVTDPSMIRIGK